MADFKIWDGKQNEQILVEMCAGICLYCFLAVECIQAKEAHRKETDRFAGSKVQRGRYHQKNKTAPMILTA